MSEPENVHVERPSQWMDFFLNLGLSLGYFGRRDDQVGPSGKRNCITGIFLVFHLVSHIIGACERHRIHSRQLDGRTISGSEGVREDSRPM